MIRKDLIDDLYKVIGENPRKIAKNADIYNEVYKLNAALALFKGYQIVKFAVDLVEEMPRKLQPYFRYYNKLYNMLLNSPLDDSLSIYLEESSSAINYILEWYIKDVCPRNRKIKFISGYEYEITREMVEDAVLIDLSIYNLDNCVSPDICCGWCQKNSAIYTMGINEETNKVVSYLNAMPINDSYFNKIASGNFLENQIPQSEIQTYERSGFYKLYICSITIAREFQNGNILIRMLKDFISMLIKLSENDIFITEVIAEVYNNPGKRMCEIFGMEKIKDTCHNSEMYKITLILPNCTVSGKISKNLLDSYEKKLSNPGIRKLFLKHIFKKTEQQTTTSIEKYDVGLSFAGENRNYVEQVANYLRSKKIKVFYDDFEKVELWGKDLYSYLSKLYKDRCNYCIMFISEHYAKKLWTNHERRNAQARAFSESREYILPARFDKTEIEGIPETIGYIDISDMKPEEFSELVIRKIN